MKVNEAGKKECPDCKGSGDCANCKGTGKVAKAAEAAKTKGKPKEMVECTDCKGTGDCPGCDGKGSVMESTRSAGARQEGENMDEAQITRIVESAVAATLAPVQEQLKEAKAANAPLIERALRGDAREFARKQLESVNLPSAAKERVISEALKAIPMNGNSFDETKLKESIETLKKSEAEYLGLIGATGGVFGMGVAPVPIDAKEAARTEAEETKLRESEERLFIELMGDETAGKAAAAKGRAA